MSISMREIAKLAGVSSATVSRVINGSEAVTPETADRIRKIIAELKFVPNNSATHLKQGKSHIFGIIIPDLTNPFFTELVTILEELLLQTGQELLLANTDLRSTRLVDSLHRMLLRRVDGVAILTSEHEAPSLASLVQNRIPVVTTDHYRTSCGIGDIVIDFPNGMMQMIAHLRELGHRRLGFIGGSEALETSRVRRESFMTAIVNHGLTSRAGWIVSGNFKIDGGSAAMAQILSQPELPTAIVTANDLTAIGAMRMAYEKGMRIPEDISVAGCDDIEMSDIVSPPLTTLRISRSDYAKMLVDALHETGKDLTKPGPTFRLPMSLVVRRSTGTPRAQSKNHASRGRATRTSEELS